MSQVKQLVVLGAFFAVCCHSAPWSDNNNFNENDLNWHCTQICTSNDGEVNFDSDTSTCYCKINSMKDSDTDWKCLANNARLLGITLEIYESDESNRIKRKISNSLADLSTTESTDANLKTTDPTLQLPLAVHRIRAKLRLHALKPPRVHVPIILRAENPEKEAPDTTPESLYELRQRIRERIAELRRRSRTSTPAH